MMTDMTLYLIWHHSVRNRMIAGQLYEQMKPSIMKDMAQPYVN